MYRLETSPAGRWLKVETDRSGKIIVGPACQYPDIRKSLQLETPLMSLLPFEICWASSLKLP